MIKVVTKQEWLNGKYDKHYTNELNWLFSDNRVKMVRLSYFYPEVLIDDRWQVKKVPNKGEIDVK